MDEDEYEEYLEEEEARHEEDEAYMNLSDLLFNQPPEAM